MKRDVSTENEQDPHYLDITIGVSTFVPEDMAETLTERADRALYLAKHCGRNQVKMELELAD